MRNFLYLLALLISFSSFGQKRQLINIKTYNEEGDYQKAFKEIKKYQDKNYDTLNFNYLISLADYYCIPKNNEYNPFKAISIVQDVNCAKISPETLEIYFKDNQDCNLVLKNKNERYVGLYFEIINKSNDLDSLKSFYTDFKSYKEYKDKIYQKIALISFNKARQSNLKSELLQFQKEFENTSFASEATVIIEEIDYASAALTNTIESYTGFLKNYPQTNKRNKILSKLEALKWQECVTLNTKTSYQTFINDFPNSTHLQEAKNMLSKFVDVFNLKAINSFYTLSNEKQMFEPFKISNGQLEHPRLTLLKISQNAKIAIAVTSLANGFNREESDNIARLIDLTDGAIIFEFPYLSLSNPSFNSDDSKLFYYDNKIIKQIDLNSFDITNVFEVESKAYNFQYMFLEKNILHFTHDSQHQFLHYTYDLTTAKKDLEIFSKIDRYISGDIQKEFSALSGSTEEKLIKLKLIYGDDIKIKPLTKNSTNKYLIFKFPNLFIIENGEFIFDKYISLKSGKNAVKTTNNRIVFTVGRELFILDLGSEDDFSPDNETTVTRLDLTARKGIMFAHLDEKTNRLYYQEDADYGCDYVNDYEIYVYNYSNKFSSSKKGLQVIIKNKLDEIDKSLSSFYNTHINSEVIKNQPLESDKEKYNRVRDIYLKMNPAFNEIQDSLFNSLNETVKDSIKIVKYDPVKVFLTSNYNVDEEYWRLLFKNPFDGKDFSVFLNQPKVDARLNLSNNFSNFLLEVKYYLNIISLTYEPLMVSITNNQSKKSFKTIVPYKDKSLLKNLHYTDNSFIAEYEKCTGEEINYDENIIKHFVSNGKPKFYFNYIPQTKIYDNPVPFYIRNLDDSNVNLAFQNNLDRSYAKLDNVPYFVNVKSDWYEEAKTYVFEFNKTAPLDIIDDVQNKGQSYLPNGLVIGKRNVLREMEQNNYGSNLEYITSATFDIIDTRLSTVVKTFDIIELAGNNNGRMGVRDYDDIRGFDVSISPNGKYFAVKVNAKTFLYETSAWTNVMNFDNTSGKLYWDCNSYYLGVGNDLIPVLLLDSLGPK